MLRDVSNKWNEDFNDYLIKKKIKMEFEFFPKVLTSGMWPSFNIHELKINHEMNSMLNIFNSFYGEKTSERKLKWIHTLGKCEILGKFEKGNKIFVTSCYQACILTLFNNSNPWKANDLKESLGIPWEVIKRELLVLTTLGVLKKEGNPKFIESLDEFKINNEFSSKLKKIKMLSIKNSNQVDIEKFKKIIKEQRNLSIDATIIRIMKSRKQITLNDLLIEIPKQLLSNFIPNVQEIKKRIEGLIEREYLELNDESEDGKIYNYLA
jgi:hypothetical protein